MFGAFQVGPYQGVGEFAFQQGGLAPVITSYNEQYLGLSMIKLGGMFFSVLLVMGYLLGRHY